MFCGGVWVPGDAPLSVPAVPLSDERRCLGGRAGSSKKAPAPSLRAERGGDSVGEVGEVGSAPSRMSTRAEKDLERRWFASCSAVAAAA
jgi:hypothetical protein